MSSTLAAAKPISANVSRAASSSRSTVSVRRLLGRCTSADVVTMQHCIGYTVVLNAAGAITAIIVPACGRRTVRARHPGLRPIPRYEVFSAGEFLGRVSAADLG